MKNEQKIIGEVNKNSLQKTVISIQEYKGKTFIDVRVYYNNTSDSEWYPTKKGIAINKENYKEIANLIIKAGEELNKN